MSSLKNEALICFAEASDSHTETIEECNELISKFCVRLNRYRNIGFFSVYHLETQVLDAEEEHGPGV